jgi:hypothetical protein
MPMGQASGTSLNACVGAVRVGLRALAAQLVQAPALAVALVAENLREAAGIEVRRRGQCSCTVRPYANFGRPLSSSSGSVPNVAYCSTTPRKLYGFGGQPGIVTTVLPSSTIGAPVQPVGIRVRAGHAAPRRAAADGDDGAGALGRSRTSPWPSGRRPCSRCRRPSSGSRPRRPARTCRRARPSRPSSLLGTGGPPPRTASRGSPARSDRAPVRPARVQRPQQRFGTAGTLREVEPDHRRFRARPASPRTRVPHSRQPDRSRSRSTQLHEEHRAAWDFQAMVGE